MERNPIRVLGIGLRNYWLDYWMAHPEVELAGVVDHYGELRSPDRSLVADVAGIPLFASVGEALDETQPDLITMVTPSERKTELDVVEQIVSRGRDLFLEKLRPVAWADGRKLLELGRRSGRQIGIGEPYRYDLWVERAKQVVASGCLGRIGQVVWLCHRPVLTAEWARAYRHVMLEDLAYHHFGAIHHLLDLGRFRRVYATSRLPDWAPLPSPSVVSLIAEGEDGAQLHYYASWAAHGKTTSWLGEFRIEGSEGMLELKNGALTFVDRAGNEEQLQPAAPHPYELRAGVANEYIRARLEQRRTDLDIKRFYPVVRLIEAALESTEQGKAVSL